MLGDRVMGPKERKAVRAVQERLGIRQIPKRKPMKILRPRARLRRVSLARYDHLEPIEAVRTAWSTAGPVPEYHEEMEAGVRFRMPLLARALDRLEREAPGKPIR